MTDGRNTPMNTERTNAEEMVKGLRICANIKTGCDGCNYRPNLCDKMQLDAADLIESLTAQLEAARFVRSDTAKDALTKAQGDRIKTLEGEKEAISKLYLEAHNERVEALAQLTASQRRADAAVDMINRLEKDITVISGASDYIKPGTGVWHTVGIMLQAIENWRGVVGEGEKV